MTTVPAPGRRAVLAGWAALGLPLLLAACGGGEAPAPQAFAPLDFSYLHKLRLNVASLQIDDTWTPEADSGQHVEDLAPEPPIDALRQMAQQRIVTEGASGQARFVIEDASILQGPGRLDGSLAVRLDVSTGDGTRSGFAEARVVRSQPQTDDSGDAGRAAAYALVRSMMDDMNVEFEFQVRRTLRDYLASGETSAAPPPPVQSQDLPPPGAATPAPVGSPTPALSPPAAAPSFAPTLTPVAPPAPGS